MNAEYMREGYELMMAYMAEKRIKTKHRNFTQRLKRFYNKHKDQEYLSIREKAKYLQLEQYFYNNIAEPTNKEEHAAREVLNILAQAKPNQGEK